MCATALGLHRHDFVEDLTETSREKRAAVDDHVDLVRARRDGVTDVEQLHLHDARPEGNAVATDATFTETRQNVGGREPRGPGRRRPRQRSARSHPTDPAGALWRTADDAPGVSAPSRVVRSTMDMARSRAANLVDFLSDRVASLAARASAPTASTPDSPPRMSAQLSFGLHDRTRRDCRETNSSFVGGDKTQPGRTHLVHASNRI